MGVIAVVFSMAGCGGQSDSGNASGVSTPVPESLLALKALNPAATNLQITLLVDPGSNQAQRRTVRTITFDESAAPVMETLDGIAVGPHQFQIEYRVGLSGTSAETSLVVAVSSILNGDVNTGQPLGLVFEESGLVFHDNDGDGFSNLAELRAGTDPIDAGAKPPVNAPPPVAAATITAQNAVEIATETFHVMETVIFESIAPLLMLNSVPGPCEFGGSLDITQSTDSVTFVAHQCRASNPDTTITEPLTTNGTLVLTQLVQTSDPAAGTSQASWRISYEQYVIVDGSNTRTLNGVNIITTSNSSQVEYFSVRVAVFTFTEGTANFAVPSLTVESLKDKSVNTTTVRFIGSVHTTLGRVDIDTVEPLVNIGEANASSGQLEITTINSGLALFPRNDGITVDVAVDANGDRFIDETLVKTWTELGW